MKREVGLEDAAIIRETLRTAGSHQKPGERANVRASRLAAGFCRLLGARQRESVLAVAKLCPDADGQPQGSWGLRGQYGVTVPLRGSGERGLLAAAALNSPLLGQHRTGLWGPADSSACYTGLSPSSHYFHRILRFPGGPWHPSPESNTRHQASVTVQPFPRRLQEVRQHEAHGPCKTGHQP